MLQVLLVVILTLVANSQQDDAAQQLVTFNDSTTGPVGVLSTGSGSPIEKTEATSSLNRHLLRNEYAIESLGHFVRERIPVRVVHPLGAGAFGYFITTKDISDICKADFLSEVGKETPIAARFSLSNSERGASDLNRETRGFSVKFYTEEGNFDIAGFNTPIFSLKEPTAIASVVHIARKNPVTDLKDPNTLWDFLTLHPEALYLFLNVFGHNGIPDGFRNMPGFSIHTYPLYNENGTITYARWRFYPVNGLKSLNSTRAATLGASDPGYCARDLYNAIADGDYPTWEVSLQLMTQEEVDNATFDPFDVTKIIPESEVPWTPIGKIVLNRTVTNYFADVEQMAFCPSNLVPGIQGAPDQIFESRGLFYKDAQRYRLGVNYDKIPVNCPFRSKYRHSYLRDGVSPINDNGLDEPNYYPNTFNGPEPYVDEYRPAVPEIYETPADNFDQINDYFSNQLTSDQQSELISNIVTGLCKVTSTIQDRAIEVFAKINDTLSERVDEGLDENSCRT